MKYAKLILPLVVSLLVWIGIALAAPMLAGSEWAPSKEAEQFLQFQDNGRVSGHGGCNRFFGDYHHSDSELAFGPIGATKKMCPEDIMKIENAFFDVLGKVKSFEREEQELKLFDEAGQGLATFQQRDWD